MEELKISKIQDKMKLDVICQQVTKNCSTQEDPNGHNLGCDYDCPNVPNNMAYWDTRW